MRNDDLEFAISQYLDGTLPPLETAALEERFATDAEARQLLGEYQRLDAVVKSSLPEPRVDLDAFANHLRSRLEQAEAPVKHYRLAWTRIGSFAAVAAAIVIAVGVAIPLLKSRTSMNPVGPAVAEVVGPQIEQSNQPAVAQVQIGAPPGMAEADAGWQSYEALINRPSRVVIGAIEKPAQDGDIAPY
jgi:anti-sigma factor RsiW